MIWQGVPGMRNGTGSIEGFPSLTSERAQIVLSQCADLTIAVSFDMQVTGVLGSHDVDAADFQSWVGQNIAELVAPDSREKLRLLTDDNSASLDGEGRWRHLNFLTETGPDLPLLLKFFRFVNEGTAFHMICARDLRPMVNVQNRFQREEMTLRTQLHASDKGSRTPMRSCSKILEIVSKTNGDTVDSAVSDALLNIERLCLLEALTHTNGDEPTAAHLLNISVEELLARLEKL